MFGLFNAKSGKTPKINDYFKDLAPPDFETLSYQLEQMVAQGVLTPEQAQAALVEGSSMQAVQVDPSLMEAQMAALAELQNITSSGGMTAADKARLNQISQQEAAQARGAREAILQNAQSRGMGGSGLELMAQLQNQQEAATRQANRDLDVAGMAQERALQALMQQGQLAGQISNQSFGQQAQIAQAQDAIAQFNAQNRQQANMFNAQAANQAQAANLQNQQNIANQNVNLRNQQAGQRAQIAQQMFNNEMAKRNSQAGIATNNASNAAQDSYARAQADNNMTGSMLQAGASLGAAYLMSDEREKEEIEPFDASEFLDSLIPKKYKYKDSRNGEGKFAGPMAQDLEKTEIGSSLVKDTPEGKMVDTGRASMAALASLAHINERLKKIEGK